MMSKIQDLPIWVNLTVFIVKVLAVIGWLLNVVTLVTLVSGASASTMEISAMFILRCVGVLFFPLGMILGWY